MRHSVSVCPSALCQLKTFSPKSLPRHVRCCIHFFTSNTQKCRNFFKNFSFIQYAAFILRQWFLPFFYVKSGSNLKTNGSFEILSSWGFQNTPYMLNLMEFWLSYMRLKTSDTTSKSNFDSTLLLLWKLSLAFNHEYLSQFLIKFKDQGQFWNLLFTRIPKVSLIFKIDKELTEIFKVKGKAQFLKKQ